MPTAEAAREATTSVNESTRANASAPLRGHVAFYSGYRQEGIAPALHRGLPSPYMTLIFTLDDQLNVAQHADLSQVAESYDSLLGGLHASPALIAHDGRQSGIQVAVSPLASRALFGVPAGELAWIDVHAADVFGRESERVRERMQEASSWHERFAAVDSALRHRLSAPDLPAATALGGCLGSGGGVAASATHARRVVAPPTDNQSEGDTPPCDRTRQTPRPNPPPPPKHPLAVPDEVARAWQLLLDSRGTIPVSALADEVGWSTRHLASRFRAEIGLTPKAAARVIRFDHTRRLLASGTGAAYGRGPGTTLSQLAVHCGYFDQAHLDREFRLLAGCSPSRWLADEGYAFRNVQAERAQAA